QNSLSDAPGKDYYRISVKREDECEATPAGIVSNYMHYHVEEGDDVFLTVPARDFYLDVTSSRPVLLIAGGVGLTPLMSMFNTLIEQYPSREVYFIQAARNGQVHAMRDYVMDMACTCGGIVLQNRTVQVCVLASSVGELYTHMYTHMLCIVLQQMRTENKNGLIKKDM